MSNEKDGGQVNFFGWDEKPVRARNTGSNGRLAAQMAAIEKIIKEIDEADKSIDAAIKVNKFDGYVVLILGQAGTCLTDAKYRLEQAKIHLKRGKNRYYAGD